MNGTSRVKRLHTREDFDDSVFHGSAFHFACRHDCRRFVGRTGYCPAIRPRRLHRLPRRRRAPLPPGSPLIGRPEGNEAASKLAPIAPPPIPAAADKLPTAQLKLPPGFNIEVYASGIANTRSLRVGDKGTVFVGTRLGNKVTAIVKKDGKTEIKTIAEGLYRPNGLAYHKGTLYIAELSQISKIDNVEANLDKPPKPTVIYNDLPKDEAHGWKFIAIGPDDKLYLAGRPAGQQRAAQSGAWPDPPHQSGRNRR